MASAYWRDVMLLAQPKVKGIDELPVYTAYFFTDDFPTDEKASAKILGKGDAKARACELLEAFRAADFSADASLEQALNALAAKHNLGPGDYVHVGRLAVSGTNVGPGFYGLYRVLGRDRALRRIERFLATLPG